MCIGIHIYLKDEANRGKRRHKTWKREQYETKKKKNIVGEDEEEEGKDAEIEMDIVEKGKAGVGKMLEENT